MISYEDSKLSSLRHSEYFDIMSINQFIEPIIYFLIDTNIYGAKEVVYVGQSKRGFKRILEHKDKKFKYIAILPCDEKDLDVTEKFYIEQYRPKYNKSILNTIIKKQNKHILEVMNNVNDKR